MLLFIVIPFFIGSLLFKFLADKVTTTSFYNKAINSVLSISSIILLIESLNFNNNLLTNPFVYLAIFTLVFSVLEFKSCKCKALIQNISVSTLMVIALYFTNLINLEFLPAIFLVALFVLKFIDKFNDVSLQSVLIIPVSISLIYYSNNLIYTALIMFLIGSIRYFVITGENKTTVTIFKQFIIVISIGLLTSLGNFEFINLITINTLVALLFGFALVTYITLFSIKKDTTLLHRYDQTQEIPAFAYIKIFLLQVYTVALSSLVAFDILNIYITFVLALLPIGFIHMKIWYLEQEIK